MTHTMGLLSDKKYYLVYCGCGWTGGWWSTLNDAHDEWREHFEWAMQVGTKAT